MSLLLPWFVAIALPHLHRRKLRSVPSTYVADRDSSDEIRQFGRDLFAVLCIDELRFIQTVASSERSDRAEGRLELTGLRYPCSHRDANDECMDLRAR